MKVYHDKEERTWKVVKTDINGEEEVLIRAENHRDLYTKAKMRLTLKEAESVADKIAKALVQRR